MPVIAVAPNCVQDESGLTGSAITQEHQMKFEVVFICTNILRVFKEVVEADSVDQAKQQVNKMVEQAGLTIQHITSVVSI